MKLELHRWPRLALGQWTWGRWLWIWNAGSDSQACANSVLAEHPVLRDETLSSSPARPVEDRQRLCWRAKVEEDQASVRRSQFPEELTRRSCSQRPGDPMRCYEWKAAAVLDERLTGVRSLRLVRTSWLETPCLEKPACPRAEHRWTGRPCLGAKTPCSPDDSNRSRAGCREVLVRMC